jgi:DNA-binding NarL/FixJ family response regulator
VRSGFRALLDARNDLDVVGEAADGTGAVTLAKTLQPDVVLMDIRMPGLDVLTSREREVMSHVAGGLTNDEIAQQLYLSPATVRTHVSRAMTKLSARDRTQLVVPAYETGLVRPGWLP